jgi:hypothetical protein
LRIGADQPNRIANCGGLNVWTTTTDWLPVRGGAWVYTAQDADQADAEVRLLNEPNASVHADCF